jgi:hypothetical protein
MKSSREKLWLMTAMIAALLCLQSCIIIPTPWSKERFSEMDLSSITPNLSCKNEVLARFGKPDVIWKTGSQGDIFIYKWKRLRGILAAGGGGGAIVIDLESDDALLILFDDADRVKRAATATKPLLESYGDFLEHWLERNKD